MALPQGIRLRHGRGCPRNPCSCSPAYEAVVKNRDGRKLRRSFRKLVDAVEWRDNARQGVRNRTIVTPTSVTFKDYAEQWLNGARDGTNLTRDLSAYKPSTVRAYKRIARALQALPERERGPWTVAFYAGLRAVRFRHSDGLTSTSTAA